MRTPAKRADADGRPLENWVRRLVEKRERLNMLGLKIAATGALLVLLSGLAIKTIGKWPGAPKGAPLLMAWFGGAAAVLAGCLMAIWE